MGKIPKKKLLIGHEIGFDVYNTSKGEIFLYKGTMKEHWKNPKYWKKVKEVL